MYRRSFLSSALALSACGPTSLRGVAAPPIGAPVTRRDFGDADPVDWPGRGPDAYPVHGIDLSKWQGEIDWPRIRAAGVNFAWIKATEGIDVIDPMFLRHHDDAARAGVAVGAYHFIYWCSDIEEQARWFIRNVPRRAGDLPHVLDLEWTPFSPTCTVRPPAAEVQDRARRFLSIVGRHYGQQPVIYATPEFFRETQIDRLGTELWLRATAQPVQDVYAGVPWRFWQYSGTGRIDGIRGNIDLNCFNGSAGQWQAWLAQRRIA